MKIWFPSGVRNIPEDRNPTYHYRTWQSLAVAPHADNLRASDLITAGKRGMLVYARVQVLRITAAGTSGKVSCSVRLLHSLSTYYVANALMLKNAIGDSLIDNFRGVIWLTANDELRIYSYDLSVTGTVDYQADYAYIEFDP